MQQETSKTGVARARQPERKRATTLRLAAVAATAIAAVALWAHWPTASLPPGTKADEVLVVKSERRLVLLHDHTELKSYTVALGGNPVGKKERQGDEKTPEGSYRIDNKLPIGTSKFHKALHISYGGSGDAGGDIMIHGIGNGFGWIGRLHRLVDWTKGCIAVTDDEIDQIYEAVQVGTKMEINP